MGLCGSSQNKKKIKADKPQNTEITRNQQNSSSHNTSPEEQKQNNKEKNSKSKRRLYITGDRLDSGAFGTVYQGLDIETGQLLAIKTVKLSGPIEQVRIEVNSLKQEISLLKKLQHKNIVKYKYTEIHEDQKAVDIVLEYVPGGSLRTMLNRIGQLDESVVRVYTTQILNGLAYLHNNNIVHRDIKCANILLDTDGTIKLTDFGTSTLITSTDQSKTYPMNNSLKGSPYWMSPEVVSRQGHTYKADIWSLGGCVIEMLTGKPPYADEYEHLRDVLMAIKRGQIPRFPRNVSDRAIKFLECIYIVDQNLRPSANELLQHEFIITSPNKTCCLSNLDQDQPIASGYALKNMKNQLEQKQKLEEDKQQKQVEF